MESCGFVSWLYSVIQIGVVLRLKALSISFWNSGIWPRLTFGSRTRAVGGCEGVNG